MKAPSVAVVIPAHNASQWIGLCLDSCIAQHHAPSEIIVVDDHSKDGTVEAIRPYLGRVKLLSSPSKGACAARNAGWRASSADFIQFLDADDYLLPTKIHQQLQECEALDETDVIVSQVWVEPWKDGASGPRSPSNFDPSTDHWTQWIRWQLPQTGGALWRRSVLEKIGGWRDEQPCCQEHELYLRALKAGVNWHHAPSIGAVYRVWSEETLCRKDPLLVVKQRTMLIDQCIGWLESAHQLRQDHRESAGQACFEMARTWARYDRAGAVNYWRDRQAAGLLRIAGPAATTLYRACLAILGFEAAESLAESLRSKKPDASKRNASA